MLLPVLCCCSYHCDMRYSQLIVEVLLLVAVVDYHFQYYVFYVACLHFKAFPTIIYKMKKNWTSLGPHSLSHALINQCVHDTQCGCLARFSEKDTLYLMKSIWLKNMLSQWEGPDSTTNNNGDISIWNIKLNIQAFYFTSTREKWKLETNLFLKHFH